MSLSLQKSAWSLVACLSIYTLSYGHKKHLVAEQPPTNRYNGIQFIENLGQWDNESKYMAEIPNGNMFLTNNSFVYNFVNEEDMIAIDHDIHENGTTNKSYRGHAYKINFVGANMQPKFNKENKQTKYHNYFIGNDPSKWKGKVGLYGTVEYKDLYPGIDLKVYGSKETFSKYDFIVSAGANPNQISLSFDGVSPTLDKAGNLVIKTSVNEIIEKAPYTYQIINNKQVTVASKYQLKNGKLSFVFPNGYDASQALIIDPTLVFASFSGAATGANYAYSTTFDSLGNTYTAAFGGGTGTNWPTTTGAYLANYPGSQTSCISKINATGSTIVYATYFGGTNGTLQPNTLRVNSNNELFLAGQVTSTNMPTTTGAIQTTLNGGSDIALVHFSEDGASLLGSTYIGGSGTEASVMGTSGSSSSLLASGNAVNPVEITFAPNGNVWVTSNTVSTNFPVTSNAYQAANAGSNDVVIFNVTPTFTNLVYSTYFGGSDWDGGIGIEPNHDFSKLYIVGRTSSTDLPVTTGSLNPNYMGGTSDGFVASLDLNSLAINKATYLGTSNQDHAQRLGFDRAGNIVVLGRSVGGLYPVTPGVESVANGNIFLHKINADLSTTINSTILGGGGTLHNNIIPSAMIVDICDNVLVAIIGDNAQQINMPLSADAYETDARNFWFGAITSDFSEIYFGSYFGTTNDHYHPGIARMDKEGIVYHSVCTTSPAYPATANSFTPVKLNGGNNDNATFKFNFEASGVKSFFQLDPTIVQNDTGCAPYTVHLKNNSVLAKDYVWEVDDQNSTTIYTSIDTNLTYTFTQPGVYTIGLYAHNDSSCIVLDSAYMQFVVFETHTPQLVVQDTTLCSIIPSLDLAVDILNPVTNTTNSNVITWGPTNAILTTNTLPNITVDPTVATTYWVTVVDTVPGYCGSRATDTVHIDLSPRVLKINTMNDTTVCEGSIINISATSTAGYTYHWDPPAGINNINLLEPAITVNQPMLYTLTASYPNCPDTSVFLNVNMHYLPHLSITDPMAVCEGTSVTLESNTAPFRNDYIYSWTPNTNLSSSDGPNAIFEADSTRTYKLHVQTPIGCATEDSVLITVYPGGFGSAVADTGYCPGNKVSLWANGGVSYSWSPVYGLNDANSATPVANPQTSTSYTVLITDVHNCVDTEYVEVMVYPEANLTIPDSVTVYPGQPHHLQPEGNASYYSWYPPSGLSNTNIADPIMNPEVRTRYFVTATTEYGCIIKDSIDVLVLPTEMDMPNAYFPNGESNGFRPAKNGIANLKSFEIFNRWGLKVYSSSNIDAGWDGTFNGVEQPAGVYMYQIDATTYEGKPFIKRGNVTLIR
jgi:gliding motility-associated-like protein